MYNDKKKLSYKLSRITLVGRFTHINCEEMENLEFEHRPYYKYSYNNQLR
jgi:hypothetical protein